MIFYNRIGYIVMHRHTVYYEPDNRAQKYRLCMMKEMYTFN